MRLRRSTPYGPGIHRVLRGRGAYPNGHIQAVGVDVAGRRQYLYHEQRRNDRGEEKFDRVLELARRLPELRAQRDEDLTQRGMPQVRRDIVDRAVIRLIR